MLINQQPASFRHDIIQCELKLRTAVAAQAVKDIASQALRVNPDQRRANLSRKIPQLQHDRLFRFSWPNAFEAVNTKLAKTSREIGLRYFIKFEIRQSVE